MATQRYISTSFWDDPWITTLDPSEKLLYLYLMTNTLTNIAGVYKIAVRRICFDTGFNSDTVGHIMTKFEIAKKAHRIGEYIAIPSWPKHQNYEIRSKIKEGITACLKELPKECLLELAKIGYKFDLQPVFDILSISYVYQPNYSDSDSDSKSDIDIKSPEIPAIIPKKENPNKEIFDAYISAYKNMFRKEPVIIYANMAKRLGQLLKEVTKDQVIAAINIAKTDDFCSRKTSFELSIILSDKVIVRLINESRKAHTSEPLSLKEKQVCPKCGNPIEFGQCIDCGIFVGLDGKEVVL